ncbi:MAG: PfkB family carbohydrate kinase, partial [Pseudomonadota bacterium]
MTKPVSLTVVGSINLDLVAIGANLPAPGETVTGATYAEYPGGKGANQARIAHRCRLYQSGSGRHWREST